MTSMFAVTLKQMSMNFQGHTVCTLMTTYKHRQGWYNKDVSIFCQN